MHLLFRELCSYWLLWCGTSNARDINSSIKRMLCILRHDSKNSTLETVINSFLWNYIEGEDVESKNKNWLCVNICIVGGERRKLDSSISPTQLGSMEDQYNELVFIFWTRSLSSEINIYSMNKWRWKYDIDAAEFLFIIFVPLVDSFLLLFIIHSVNIPHLQFYITICSFPEKMIV